MNSASDPVTASNKKTIQLSDDLLMFLGFALEARRMQMEINETASRKEDASGVEYWRQEHLKVLAFLVEFRIAERAAA